MFNNVYCNGQIPLKEQQCLSEAMPIGEETEADLVGWIGKQIFVWRIPH